MGDVDSHAENHVGKTRGHPIRRNTNIIPLSRKLVPNVDTGDGYEWRFLWAFENIL
jgi:hypothetical protein